MDLVLTVHTYLGYLVSLVLIVVTTKAFGRAKDAREFVATPFSLGLVLLDVQVLLGIVLYALDGYWDAAPLIAYVHPLLALAALGVGHASLGRARRVRMAVDAHRAVGRGLLTAFILVLAAIGVASFPGAA